MAGTDYLKYLNPLSMFNAKRTRDIFQVNPTIAPVREEATEIVVQVFNYSATHFEEKTFAETAEAVN